MDADRLKKYMEAVYSRCCRLLRDRELAWDALQEVMTRYYEVAARQSIEQPLHLLYKISTNHCLDLLQRHKRSLLMEPALLQDQSGGAADPVEERLLLEKLLSRFGEETVTLLVYRYVDQMTYQEIAQLYDLSDRGMKKKMDRLEEQVRKYLNRS